MLTEAHPTYLHTARDAKAFDEWVIESVGVPGLLLMENAGAGATRYLLEVAGEHLDRVAIVGGLGQNGGDAWVVARHLFERGIHADVFVVGDPAKISGDAKVQFELLTKLGIETKRFESFESEFEPDSYSLMVDGIFGTGLSRPPEGVFAEAVMFIDACAERVFSLDVPSGICASTGQMLGREAVRAHWTATFGAHKRGLHQQPGAAHAGETRLVPLGAPHAGARFASARVFDESEARLYLRMLRLEPGFHKGRGGHVAVVGGAEGMTGAAMLAGRAALRAGAGKATVFTRAAVSEGPAELMLRSIGDGLVDELERLGVTSLLLGPGLGRDADAAALTEEVVGRWKGALSLDADALIALGPKPNSLQSSSASIVITPHPGEAAHLLGTDVASVQADRFAAARALCELGVDVAILKGAYTVVAVAEPWFELAQARELVCSGDVPALAVPGSGDVLGGAIAALRGQFERSDDVWKCAALGVRWHSMAGAGRSHVGTLAGEIADALPRVLMQHGVLTQRV